MRVLQALEQWDLRTRIREARSRMVQFNRPGLDEVRIVPKRYNDSQVQIPGVIANGGHAGYPAAHKGFLGMHPDKSRQARSRRQPSVLVSDGPDFPLWPLPDPLETVVTVRFKTVS